MTNQAVLSFVSEFAAADSDYTVRELALNAFDNAPEGHEHGFSRAELEEAVDRREYDAGKDPREVLEDVLAGRVASGALRRIPKEAVIAWAIETDHVLETWDEDDSGDSWYGPFNPPTCAIQAVLVNKRGVNWGEVLSQLKTPMKYDTNSPLSWSWSGWGSYTTHCTSIYALIKGVWVVGHEAPEGAVVDLTTWSSPNSRQSGGDGVAVCGTADAIAVFSWTTFPNASDIPTLKITTVKADAIPVRAPKGYGEWVDFDRRWIARHCDGYTFGAESPKLRVFIVEPAYEVCATVGGSYFGSGHHSAIMAFRRGTRTLEEALTQRLGSGFDNGFTSGAEHTIHMESGEIVTVWEGDDVGGGREFRRDIYICLAEFPQS